LDKRVEKTFITEDKKPRTKIEAFVKPYIQKLVGKPTGTSVNIPYTIKPTFDAQAVFMEVRNAISLWMGRLITHSETGWYTISYVKEKHHFTITLKKDHGVAESIFNFLRGKQTLVHPDDIKTGIKYRVTTNWGGKPEKWIYQITDASDKNNVLYTIKPEHSSSEEGYPAYDEPLDLNDLYDGDEDDTALKSVPKGKPQGSSAKYLAIFLNDHDAVRLHG
jgi:hypothetical protein